MKQKIERLRSLMEKATPGPWEACQKGDYGDFDGESRVLSNRDQRIAVFHHGGCEINQAECDAAIELTAEAVNALPDLLSHIDALESRVVEQVEQHNKLHELAEEYLARAEAAERALAEAVEVLGDISNPIRALQREASAEGRKLSGAAYAIANDLHFVQGIARAFLTKMGEK